MVIRKGRKVSGGKYRQARKLKKREKKRQARIVVLGNTRRKKIRMLGGKYKVVLLSTDKANVIDKNGKARKVKIKNVLEVPSNKLLARKNVLCKGAIIETEIGKAKITNRPSQEGNVQAILID